MLQYEHVNIPLETTAKYQHQRCTYMNELQPILKTHENNLSEQVVRLQLDDSRE